MSKRYTGNFISGTPQVPTLTSNNGVFDIKDVYTAVNNSAWQEPDGYYEIGKSLRIRSSVGAYLSKTFTADGNRKTWTWSFWVKRGKLGDGPELWSSAGPNHPGGADIAYNGFNGSDQFIVYMYPNGGPATYNFTTTRVFRDPSAWYHIVVGFDTTQANGVDRIKIYVNGVQETSFSTQTIPSQNYASSYINSTRPQVLGHEDGRWRYPFDGHLAEWYFIDGQQLDPSYFGYFDPVTNIWQPKKYTGSYGTNGFYLPFKDNTTTYGLGKNYGIGTNLVTYSEQIDNAAYTKGNATVTANAVADPLGLTTADKLIANTTNGYHTVSIGATVVSGQRVTMSVYAKAAEYGVFLLNENSNCNAQAIFYVNPSAAAASTASSNNQGTYNAQSKIEPVGNGWYRCSVTFTASGFTTIGPTVYLANSLTTYSASFAGDNSSGMYFWGFSVNYGEPDQPYIQTTSSTINNDWTPNNISLTSGATYDSMVDSPTNVMTTATDVGGVVSGNYATLSSIDATTNSSLTDGNLTWTNSSGVGNSYAKQATFWGPGKWYFEVTATNGGYAGIQDTAAIGVMVYDPATTYSSRAIGYGSNDFAWRFDGYKANNGTTTAYGTAVNANNDVVMCAYDTSNNTVWFGKNGTWFGSSNPATATSPAFTDTTRTDLAYLFKPVVWSKHGGSGTITNAVNFGQRPFAYTPPAGFKSLNTTNLQALGSSAVGNAAIKPYNWFDINLYGGTGTVRTITNSGFQPDLVWTKVRNTTYSHNIADSVRGPGVRLYSDGTAAEAANPNGGVTAFYPANTQKYGYQIDSGVEVNEAGKSYVSWQWKQSPTSGFNIITYTGNNTANRTISHNLGIAPSFIITKNRDDGTAYWATYHKSTGTTQKLYLNATQAPDTVAGGWISADSSNITLIQTGVNNINTNGNKFVMYCWAEVPGFSKFGSYTGSGTGDGPFIHCGFTPKFVLMKATDATYANDWCLIDFTRRSVNDNGVVLRPNLSNAEVNDTGAVSNAITIDILSNGFKPRGTSARINASGSTVIFAAFAESPFALNNRAR